MQCSKNFLLCVVVFLTYGVLNEAALAGPDRADLTAVIGDPSADLSAKGVFNLVDKDGDDRISREELRVHKMDVFFVRDKDKDTHLSRREFDSLSEAVYTALDEDEDGRISGFEFNQSKLTMFETIDADGNGEITLQEFQAFRLEIKE